MRRCCAAFKTAVTAAISKAHGVRVADLVLAGPGRYPLRPVGRCDGRPLRNATYWGSSAGWAIREVGIRAPAPRDEAGVRRWLVDYLVAQLGCDADQIGRGATMHDLGWAPGMRWC